MSDNDYHPPHGNSFAEHCERMDEERAQELAHEQERQKRDDWYFKLASKNERK